MDDLLFTEPASQLEDNEAISFNDEDETCLYAPADLKKIVDLFRDHEPIKMGISGSL